MVAGMIDEGRDAVCVDDAFSVAEAERVGDVAVLMIPVAFRFGDARVRILHHLGGGLPIDREKTRDRHSQSVRILTCDAKWENAGK